MTQARQTLSDVELTRLVFQDGDRVVVRVMADLTPSQKLKIAKTVCRFAKAEVRVLIVNCVSMRINLFREDHDQVTLAGRRDIRSVPQNSGRMNIDCSIVDLQPDDKLFVSVPRVTSDIHKKSIWDWMRQWAGPDVEIIVIGTRD